MIIYKYKVEQDLKSKERKADMIDLFIIIALAYYFANKGLDLERKYLENEKLRLENKKMKSE